MATRVIARTAKDDAEYAACVLTVRNGKSTYIEVGIALGIIKAKRYYRDTHRSWQEYCEKEWGFCRGHGYRLIATGKLLEAPEKLATVPSSVMPPTVAQARELSKLPEHMRFPLWEAIVASAPKALGKPVVSLALVRTTVTEKLLELAKPVKSKPGTPAPKAGGPPTSAAVPVDCYGRKLTYKSQAFMEQGVLFDDIVRLVQKAKKLLKAMKDEDVARHMPYSRIEADLTNARSAILHGKPHCACVFCGQKGCQACRELGVIPKSIYDAADGALKK